MHRLISSTKDFMGSPQVANALAAGALVLAITAG